MRRWVTLGRNFILALALGASIGTPTFAQAQAWKASPDDALLFDVRLGKYRLGDGVRGYATPNGTCLDFADVIMALDLPIRLDKQSRRATGWAFEEQRSITIDRETGREQITNEARKVAPDDIYDTPEGWCVDTKILSRWLGVALEPDSANALLLVKADRKLPPQLAAERRARTPVAARPVFDLAQLPQANAPWRGVKAPSVDVVASIGGLRDRRTGNRVDAQYEIYASGEAGAVAYDARLSSDRHGVPATVRIRAYRTDPLARLPLRATTIAAGDVNGFSTPLVAQTSVGRGAMITSRPVDRPDIFDRTTFRGELPQGWDAELYRNGQLLAFANNRADGRYEFTDVPLLYGQNRFEVVLYGPQGQIRREIKTVPVGIESIPPRQTWYWAGINEDGRDLITLDRRPSFGQRGWRGTVGVERGIDAKTSVQALAHSLIVDREGRHSYVEGAVRRAIGPAIGELSVAAEARGGTALRAQTLGQIGRSSFGIETIWANGGFLSDRIQRDVTGLHTVSFDRAFGTGASIMPVHIDARYTSRRVGNDAFDIASRISRTFGRISLTGELAYRGQRRAYGPDPPGLMEAGLLVNARVGRVRVRGETRFRINPDKEFQSATLVGEWSAGGSLLRPTEWRAEVGYDRLLDRGRGGLGYIRRFDRFALTATGELATDGSVAAGLNLAFSIGPDPRSGRGIRVSADKLAAQGSVLARVYRDVNGNRMRDAGELLEKEVQVAAGRVPVDRLTDMRGEVVIDGLEPFQPVLIGIDASSLPDPFVQPSTPGVVVTPRPGVAVPVELPLASAGDVDGTLVKAGGGRLEGVDLELVDGEGIAIARTRSDFDGFFLFEGVPYGRYTLRIEKLAAEAARLVPVLGRVATVSETVPSAHIGTVAAEQTSVVAAR